MKNEFIAIDVETANSSRASICQIGIAKFRDGVVVDEWSSLINPEEDFAKQQMIIHGIKQKNATGVRPGHLSQRQCQCERTYRIPC